MQCRVEWRRWSDSARVGRAFRNSGHMVRAGISKGQRGVATQTALRDCVVHVMLAADFSKASRGRGGSSLCFHPSSAHLNSVAYSSPYIHTAMIKRRTYELVWSCHLSPKQQYICITKLYISLLLISPSFFIVALQWPSWLLASAAHWWLVKASYTARTMYFPSSHSLYSLPCLSSHSRYSLVGVTSNSKLLAMLCAVHLLPLSNPPPVGVSKAVESQQPKMQHASKCFEHIYCG
jgi:hypothetical protein